MEEDTRLNVTMKLLSFLAAGMLAAVGLAESSAHALAGSPYSTACSSGQDTRDIPILTSPVTLGVQIGTAPGAHGAQDYVGLCYATSSTSNSGPEATGGVFQVGLTPSTSSPQADAQCYADSYTSFPVNCNNYASATPSYTVGPGETITVSIPFAVCADVCSGGPAQLNETGLIVGGIAACPNPIPGSPGACEQLNQLALFVDGIQVANLAGPSVGTGMSLGAIADNLYGGGPCVLGVCPPLSGYIATTGQPFLVVVLPTGEESIAPSPDCIYQNPNGACPY